MADRIARPPVRLRGGMPDGNLCGANDVAPHFLKGEPDNRYAVVELARRQLVHDDETGGDVAVLGVVAIEFPGNQDELARMLTDHRGERTGAGVLPFEPETDAERARELEHRIEVWATTNGIDARTEWVEHFGPGDQAPVGPPGAGLPHLLEFTLERGIKAEQLDDTAAVVDAHLPDDEPDDDSAWDGVPAGRAVLDGDELAHTGSTFSHQP